MSERKIWFITRPERDPKFHRDALLALSEATNQFTLKWSRNRHAHLAYERVLSNNGVKRENISNDGSGGRTWAAMLKTFAYVYTDDNGYLVLTKVGKKLLEGEKINENVTKQILTLQIPNAYFLESGFRPKFEPDFRIRPARFLIRLTNQSKLNYYLTKEEITFFALTAKNDKDLDTVTDKIVEFRNADPFEKSRIKNEVADQYDHRDRSDKGARDYEVAHGDVAHTFMMLCDYTELAEYIRGEALRVNPSSSSKITEIISLYELRYPFNNRFLISLQRMAENNGLDIDSYKASNFAGNKPASNRRKTEKKIHQLLSSYPDWTILTTEKIAEILSKEFPVKEAIKHAEELELQNFNSLAKDFVEEYLNEPHNLVFEPKTGELFKALGFEVEMRPKPLAIVGTEIEILLKYNGEQLGLIDAKNYREKFALSASLTSHMASEYIPNYEGYEGGKVSFFGYVTAASWSGEKNLEKISKLVQRVIIDREIPGFMISAKVLLGFLDFCIDNRIPLEDRAKLFLRAVKNKGYSTVGEFLREVNKVEE